MKKIKTIRAAMIGCFLLLSCVLLAGCGKGKTDSEKSPTLTGVSVSSYNEGSESKQYVKVLLNFDKDISIADKSKDSLRITISKDRVKSEDYTIKQGENSRQAEVLISVKKVTKGTLEIQKSEKADAIEDIMDASGSYAANDFDLEALVPSGVTMSDVASDDTSVTKQVDTAWNIRSIVWVCLTKDGEQVPIDESDDAEKLDGYVAVHGHEFLQDDEADTAEKMVESLSRVYGDAYSFTCDKNRVTAKALNGETGTYDIAIYQYTKIDGKDVTGESGEGESDGDQHETGVKTKVSTSDRTPSAAEQAFLNQLHISQNADQQIRDGSELYTTMTITGDAMPEEEIYSVRDLEELIQLAFQNSKMNEISLPTTDELTINGQKNTYYGIDFKLFADLCGVDVSNEKLSATIYSADGTSKTADLGSLLKKNASVRFVFAEQSGPLHREGSSVMGPVAFAWMDGDETTVVGDVSKIVLNKQTGDADPEYEYHNREPYTQSLDKTFTVEVYKKGSEYLGAVQSKTFTTKDFEALMKQYPEHVVGNWYGTIGSEQDYQYMGTGGWLDYFVGLDLQWLLTDQVGLTQFDGTAELIDRDNKVYGTIDNLQYFLASGQEASYYVLSADGVKIPNAVPMIACTKNGYPILPKHDHESVGYIAYNHLNDQLQAKGIETEVGVVKNHSGPFIACLGNLDGYYGGNQIETGGDCIKMKIYLN